MRYLASQEITREVFARLAPDLPALKLRQSWEPVENPRLRAGEVKWLADCAGIWVAAHLVDDDPHNPLEGFNVEAYRFGDVFEIFLGPGPGPRYWEIHVAPSGAGMQCCFARGWRQLDPARQAAAVAAARAAMPGYESWVSRHPEGWGAVVRIPWKTLEMTPRPDEPISLRYAFCRYDYTRGIAEPVLSSSAPLTRCDFHRVEEWNAVRLVPDWLLGSAE